MYVDTHVHLTDERYEADLPEVVHRAESAGVGLMLIPAIDIESIERAVGLSERNPGVFLMAGLHPGYAKGKGEPGFAKAAAYASHPRVVAIGESGLDYYRDRSYDDEQRAMLRRHARLAIECSKPLVLHNREADDDLLRILAEEKEASTTPERLRGVFHCFSGPPALAEAAIALGFLLGIGGNVTYKNSPTAAALADINLSDIVLETDGPYLAPVPYRGKRNEPSYVPIVAEAVARIKGVTVEEVAAATTSNAIRLFGLPDYRASSSSTTS